MKTLILTFMSIFFAFLSLGQTTIWTENFNDASQYSVTLGAEGNDGTADYFQRTDGTNINMTYSNITSTYFFAGQDIDDPDWTGSASPSQLTWSSIDISSYTSLSFYADFASVATNFIDNSDYIHIEYNIDGGGWIDLIWFENDGSTYNTYFLEDTDFDGDGDGTQLTSSLSTFTKTLPNGASLQLRMTVAVNAGGEDFAIDNIMIKGTASGSVQNPSNFTSSAITSTQISISWTQNSNSDDVLLAWSADGTFGSPTDGTTYSNGDAISGGGTVLYVGSNTLYSHTSLTPNTQYYYKAWSVDGSTNYSSGVTSNATTFKAEPTNHVASFTAGTSTTSTIPLTWSDNDGSDVADGFLIKASTTNSFSNPTDGVAEADDTDLSDGSGQVNVSHGTETYTFTGLDMVTTYYFQIWPYSNSGTAIDYKTNGGIPSANATTSSPNLDLIISEISDPSDNYHSRFVELYNLSSSTIDFDNETWYLSRQSNGGSTWEEKQLSGSVLASEEYVAANNNNDASDYFYSDFGFMADYDYGGSAGNGDDGYFLFYGGDHSAGTLVDAYGVIDQDGTGTDWEYEDSKAVRLRSVSSPNTTWTASEWSIIPADVSDMTPAAHNEDVNWVGNLSDWNTKGSDYWSGTHNYIPDPSFNVTISSGVSSMPVTSAASYCNNLTINANASASVSYNAPLTVYGNLSINATGAKIITSSNASGNGSLIVKGSTSGNADIERYFEAYSSSADGWHYISSPVASMAIASSDFDPTGTNNDLYAWDEDDYLWRDYKGSNFPTTYFENGKGYVVAYESTVTNHFIGALNNSDITFTNLSKTPTKGNGWHLLGNPFPSAIEWNTSDWNLNEFGGIAKVYNENAGTYTDISAGEKIPSTNAFFVQASSATNSITIPLSSRVHDATNNYKFFAQTSSLSESLKLIINCDANTFYDETNIRFNDEATNGFDWEFDSHKMFGQALAPQIWTKMQNEEMSTNSLPYIIENLDIPLYFKAGVNSVYHISTEDIDDFYPNTEIYLEDKVMSEIINLRDNPSYSFQANVQDANNRFILHFYLVTEVSNNTKQNEFRIINDNSTIYVAPLNSEYYQMELYDINCRSLYYNHNCVGNHTINMGLKPGIYILKLIQSGKTVIKKLSLI